MKILSVFSEHPASVGETYLQHLRSAVTFGGSLVIAGIACLIHAIMPFLFVDTASRTVRSLYERIVTGRRRDAQSLAVRAKSGGMRGLHSRLSPRLQLLVSVAPGVLIAVALAIVAKLIAAEFTEHTGGRHGIPLSPVLVAVLLGVIWRNTIGLPEVVAPGINWTMQTVLRIGIALIGFRLTLAGATSSALIAAPIAIACIVTALVTGFLICKWLRVPRQLSLLLAIGAAVCGCTAVAALAPVIRARVEETSVALFGVVLFGCIGMLIYPQLAHHFFAGAPLYAGIFLGTSIHDTSQVVGAALIYAQQFDAPSTLEAAGVAKLVRNLALAALIPAIAFVYPTSDRAQFAARGAVIPTFVVAFVSLVLVRSAGDALVLNGAVEHAWSVVVRISQQVSEFLLICGMSAVGFSVSLREVRRVGWLPLVAGLLIAALVGLCSLALTSALLAHAVN